MTTQQREYIIAIVEEGSFTKAAAKLFVTPPSISQLVKNLEKQLGAPLFNRETTPMQLTPVGKAYFNAAKKIQATERELENLISDFSELETGSLTIGTTPFRAACLLPTSLKFFHEMHPGIDIQVIVDSIPNLQNQLQDGKLDFCIENSVFDISKFNVDTIATEQYYLAVPPSSPLNHGHEDNLLTKDDIRRHSASLFDQSGIDIHDCSSETFLLPDNHSYTSHIMERLEKKAGFIPCKTVKAYNLDILFHWILADMGIGLIPATLIYFGNYTEHPNYYKIKNPDDTISITEEKIVVASSPKHYFTDASKEYLHLLKQLIGEGTWLLDSKAER